MHPLTRERLAANAFRTLGISASANQAAIETAARRMGIWPDPRRIPPTSWDLPWLGTISRSRNDLRQAVALLNEPRSRIEERLLWFHGDRPPDDNGQNNPQSGSIIDQHNRAIASLQTAWVKDQEVREIPRWQGVLEAVMELSLSPEYVEWVTRCEAAGTFEKTASPDEISTAIRSLPAAFAASVIPKAEAALQQDEIEPAIAIVSLLQSAGSWDSISQALSRLLDRLEDMLDIECRELDNELRGKLATNRQYPGHFYLANYEPTLKAANAYNERIDGPLQHFCTLAKDDPERLARVRSKCGQVIALVALGWEWSGKFIAAEQWLLAGLKLTEGTANALDIRKSLERCAPLAEQERELQRNSQSEETSEDERIAEEIRRARHVQSVVGVYSQVNTHTPPQQPARPSKPATRPRPVQVKKNKSRAPGIVLTLFALTLLGRLFQIISNTTSFESRPDVNIVAPTDMNSQPGAADAVPAPKTPEVEPPHSFGEVNREQ